MGRSSKADGALQTAVSEELDGFGTGLGRRRLFATVLVVALGVVLAVTLSDWMREREQSWLATRFSSESRDRVLAIERAFDEALVSVESLATLLEAFPELDRQDFEAFARPALARHSSLQALGFDPVVKLEDRAAFEAEGRRQGYAGFEIVENDAEGGVVRAAERPEYVAVKFIEPVAGNEKAVGFDIASEAIRLNALQRARDLGEVTATGGIRLVQETGHQMGFLVCAPVYERGKPHATQAERHENLIGYAVGVFRVGDIVERALSGFELAGVALRLEDVGGVGGATLYGPPDPPAIDRGSPLHVVSEIRYAGRDWRIDCRPTETFLDSSPTWEAAATLWAVLLLTVIFAGYTFHLTGLNQRLRRSIAERSQAEAKLAATHDWMQLALGAIDGGIWDIDFETQKMHLSPGLDRMLGYAPFELPRTFEGWKDRIHPDDRARVMRAFEETLAGKRRIDSQEYRLRHASGEWVWVLDKSYPVQFEGAERPTRITGTTLDITERMAAEEALRLRDRAIRSASNGVLITDATKPDNPIVFVNEAFERITGYSAEEAIGRNCRFLQREDIDQAGRDELRAAMAEKREARVVLRNYRKDGSLFWIELMISPVLDAAGEVTHFIGIQDDITARKEAEGEKLRLEYELRQSQKLDAVGTLASGVAHDFNNLLTAIEGHTERAREELDSNHLAREALDLVTRACEQATVVARSLLTFSNRTEFEKLPLDLVPILRESMKLLQHLLPASIELEQMYPAGGVWIEGDRHQLQQVVMNLVINARDAMPSGGRLEIRVELEGARSLDSCGASAVLSVRDDGCGMSRETAARVFEPFFTTKGRAEGTGLGLSVVHGIVTDHQGTIQLESEPGRGTRVEIRLPACEATPVDRVAARGFVTPSRPAAEGGLILVAEDNELVQPLIVSVLESCGYEVLIAPDGVEVGRLFREHQASLDLLVLDLDLPKRSGLDCLREVRSRRPELPVVIVSGNIDQYPQISQDPRLRLLSKPFRMGELCEVVEELLSTVRSA